MNDWEDHRSLCKSIKLLADEEKVRIDQSCRFESHLSPTQKNKLVRLVGEKCNINCTINNVNSEVLWDTGSQVSLISKEWVHKHAPLSTIMDLSELMDRKLDVISAGGVVKYRTKVLFFLIFIWKDILNYQFHLLFLMKTSQHQSLDTML